MKQMMLITGLIKRKKPDHKEHELQVACVGWFRAVHPEYAKALYSVPNGAYLYGNVRAAARLRAEGMLRGVADLHLMVPRGGYHGLLIEMKADGYARKEQKEWGAYMETLGYKYVIVRHRPGKTGIEVFKEVVEDYLRG